MIIFFFHGERRCLRLVSFKMCNCEIVRKNKKLERCNLRHFNVDQSQKLMKLCIAIWIYVYKVSFQTEITNQNI